MKRAEVLAEAGRLIDGDRDQQYGTPQQNLGEIAAMWSVLLGIPITARQVALCEVATKLCRSKRSPTKADHYIDIAGYAAIAGELSET